MSDKLPDDISACEGDETHATVDQAYQIAKRAGQAAAAEILTTIGIDVSSPEKIIQVQVVMAHLRRERLAAEEAPKIIKRGAITIFLTGTVAIAVLGIRAWIKTL